MLFFIEKSHKKNSTWTVVKIDPGKCGFGGVDAFEDPPPHTHTLEATLFGCRMGHEWVSVTVDIGAGTHREHVSLWPEDAGCDSQVVTVMDSEVAGRRSDYKILK